MKNYNKLIFFSIFIYMILAIFTAMILKWQKEEKGQFYKVEINRILAEIKEKIDTKEKIKEGKTEIETLEQILEILKCIDLSNYKIIQEITYLPIFETKKEVIMDFYYGSNGKQNIIYPFYQEQLLGYLRFDYQEKAQNLSYFFVTQAALLGLELFLLIILFYLKYHLIQPFDRIQDMPYQLSKGNLQNEVKAEKNQYLGKFLWGLDELKDALFVSRKRELELQKEKKLLLLSLSHDIKTPLNMIKLYAKALYDGIYAKEEQRTVYSQIQEKVVQIENFVNEIVKASKEDIIHIEVEQGEFYLKQLIQWIESFYGEKCALRKCNLTIGTYQNRIFRGDFNRLLEVIENIFVNAFKYGDGRQIKVSFYEEEYCQLIRIFNTGETVSEKEFVHLFDSFFRGENTRGQQGNGLGLYICREIMHKMNGEIFAECEKDGMAFIVVLPLS